MADEPQQIRGIHWRETFPFTHLFRAFRVAVHPSKLVLGLIALLSLYVGGRVLDGIWSARWLAVPDEVGLYEKIVTTGGTNDQFIPERQRTREAIEDAYAQRLLTLGIVKDRQEAEKGAQSGDQLGDIKKKILEERAKRRKDADAQLNTDLAAANQMQDARDRERAQRH